MADHTVTQFELHNEACRVRGRIELKEGGLEIYLDGYGTCAMAPGRGAPIYLEIPPGEADPKLFVWADIDQEDPTHAMSLKGARESDHISPQEET
jgi:hypothetical protein